jgi:hypothetical protein
MAEVTGDNKSTRASLGFETDLHAQAGTRKSGIRVLQRTGEYNPLTFVERGRVGFRDYYQQKFQAEASSPFWRGYAKDKDKNATGIFLDNDILLWIPLAKSLAGTTVTKLVEKKYPQAQVVGRFNLTGKPLSGDIPELALESGSGAYDKKMDDLVMYFGKSLDWEERIIRLKVSYASGQQSFAGSLQEYLMFH